MSRNFVTAILVFLVFTILLGVAYPLFSTVVVNQVFSEKAQGSLIKKDGKILGSELIGQNFSDPKYLLGRLSATSPSPYNAAASAGSNLDLGNPALEKNINDRVALLKKFDPENNNTIPIDLVTSSASGLDPEISLDAALYQAKRIAEFRKIPEEKVRGIIKKHTTGKQLGLFGEKRVNFLKVNLDLDEKI